MSATQTELRLARLIDEREITRTKHEKLLADVEARDDKTLSETEESTIKMYREKAADFDVEIKDLAAELEKFNQSVEESKALRRALSGGVGGDENGEFAYRTLAEYARDVIITRNSTVCSQIANQFASKDEVETARQRMQLIQRTPANTLSSNVGGLTPPQHIDQIFQVINTSRPIVASATHADLLRGQLTYPKVTTRPVVAVQNSEKSEAGNTGMVIDMVTATASTYLGGGDLSWQAINWSTPNALDLWFQLTAADYALKTEQDAATVLKDSGWTYKISSGAFTSGSGTFAQLMTAIGTGYSTVYSNSGRTADTVYMAPDAYGYLLGLTSNAFTQFTTVNGSNVGPLNIVISRGMDSGEIIVGDSNGLLCAETAGAPVELRVVEPAIGGVEVGIIGAFEAAVVDAGAFSTISSAS